MSTKFESQPKREERENGQVEELTEFINNNDLSGEEINNAYLIAMGIGLDNPDVEGATNPPRKEVYLLAERMNQLMNEGLVVNRITELIESKKESEKKLSNAVHDYNIAVDSSNFSDREKKLLKSIIRDLREGTLSVSCLVRDSKTNREQEVPLGEIKITVDKNQKQFQAKLALLLIEQLGRVMEMAKPQVLFTE